jgi:hypothetical protein
LGIANIADIADIVDIATGITDISTDIADIGTDICGYQYRYCGYCRLDIVNVVVKMGRRVQGVIKVSCNTVHLNKNTTHL